MVEKRLKSVLPDVVVDLFEPVELKHRFHRGCARIETNEDIDDGELNIGFRYNVFLKPWEPRKDTKQTTSSIVKVLKTRRSEDFTWTRKISSEPCYDFFNAA